MTKVTLSTVGSIQQNPTSAATAINNNSSAIETAFDNTISRDGSSPNAMGGSLDMNNNQILNLPAPLTVDSPVRLIDVTTNPTITIPPTGTSGHVVPYLDGNNAFSGTNTFPSLTIGSTVETFPTSGLIVGTTDTQTLTNKTLTSPTMTTPTLGAATATTLNGLAITTSAGGSLTITPAKAFQVNSNLVIGSSADGTLTFQGTDTYVGRATTDTLTNKTIDTTSNTLKIHGVTANTAANLQGLLSVQAIIFSQTVNFNVANTDTAFTIPALPTGYTRYVVSSVRISGSTGSLSTATAGLFTATGGGGSAIVTGGSAISITNGTDGTVQNAMAMGVANANIQSFTATGFPTLYFRVANAQGVAATATVTLTLSVIP